MTTSTELTETSTTTDKTETTSTKTTIETTKTFAPTLYIFKLIFHSGAAKGFIQLCCLPCYLFFARAVVLLKTSKQT